MKKTEGLALRSWKRQLIGVILEARGALQPRRSRWERRTPHRGFRDSKRRSALDPRKRRNSPRPARFARRFLPKEAGRWPDNEWRRLVAAYREKVGMTRKIAELRARQPIQYLHLPQGRILRAHPGGLGEPAFQSVEIQRRSSGWVEELLQPGEGTRISPRSGCIGVLNHREGSVGMRMKPDFISEMNMAREGCREPSSLRRSTSHPTTPAGSRTHLRATRSK